jgi:hypothetical protein
MINLEAISITISTSGGARRGRSGLLPTASHLKGPRVPKGFIINHRKIWEKYQKHKRFKID